MSPIQALQAQSDTHHLTPSESDHLFHLNMQLEQNQNTDETMRAKRARIKRLKEGDINAKFFHHTVIEEAKTVSH